MELWGLTQNVEGRVKAVFGTDGKLITYPLKSLALAHIENHPADNSAFDVVRYSDDDVSAARITPASKPKQEVKKLPAVTPAKKPKIEPAKKPAPKPKGKVKP